ncbi:hypothetical protein FOA20_17145 [Peribacillus simplex]
MIEAGDETPAGNARSRETPQAQSAEEAPGPPAESECLERKSTFYIKKTLQKRHSVHFFNPVRVS